MTTQNRHTNANNVQMLSVKKEVIFFDSKLDDLCLYIESTLAMTRSHGDEVIYKSQFSFTNYLRDF